MAAPISLSTLLKMRSGSSATAIIACLAVRALSTPATASAGEKPWLTSDRRLHETRVRSKCAWRRVHSAWKLVFEEHEIEQVAPRNPCSVQPLARASPRHALAKQGRGKSTSAKLPEEICSSS